MSSRQWNTISSSGHKHFDEYYGCERKEVSSSFLDSTWKCDCALWMGKNKIKIQSVDYIIVFARHERVLHFIRLPLSVYMPRSFILSFSAGRRSRFHAAARVRTENPVITSSFARSWPALCARIFDLIHNRGSVWYPCHTRLWFSMKSYSLVTVRLKFKTVKRDGQTRGALYTGQPLHLNFFNYSSRVQHSYTIFVVLVNVNQLVVDVLRPSR